MLVLVALVVVALLAQAAPDAMTTWVELLKQGPMGVVSAFLLYISYTLWQENKALRKDIDALHAARLEDHKKMADEMLALAREVQKTSEDLIDLAKKYEDRPLPR